MLDQIKSKELFKETIYGFIGQKLPKFELSLLNGSKLDSESLRGKPTLINFWFSSCSPCIEEMPLLNEIRKKIGDEANFISITFQNSEDVSDFLTRTDFNFIHAVDSKEYIKEFGFFGYPKTLILDKNLIITAIEKMILEDTAQDGQNRMEFETRILNQINELKKL